MFHREVDSGFRGIFVAQLQSSLAGFPEVDVEVEVVAQHRGKLDYLGANRRVRARWDRGGYDLVHCHYGLTGLATLGLPETAPLVATLYGSDVNIGWQRAVSKVTLARARRRVFVSRRLAERWVSPRNVVLPNGVDFGVCRPIDREDACRSLGLDPGRRWILFGGNPANPVKGHRAFREALRVLQSAHPEASELILSEPGQAFERVVLKMNAATCLLFTSLRGTEGSPTVVKEALAVGLPVVSVDVGDASEMLEGVTPGGIVPWPRASGEAEHHELARSLAASVALVLESGRRSNGREVRGFLRQEEIARRIVAIYQEVAREARRDLGYR